jgi:hypothetical protein
MRSNKTLIDCFFSFFKFLVQNWDFDVDAVYKPVWGITSFTNDFTISLKMKVKQFMKRNHSNIKKFNYSARAYYSIELLWAYINAITLSGSF